MQPIPTARAEFVHQSRWGYHPCDRDTFLLLKRLFRHWLKAVRGYHVWQRWERKDPRNRVVRHVIRNHQGQRVGAVVAGPRLEPALCPVFTRRMKVRVYRDRDGKFHEAGFEVEHVVADDLGVEAAYRAARRPKATPEEVQPLTLTTERIRELLARLET